MEEKTLDHKLCSKYRRRIKEDKLTQFVIDLFSSKDKELMKQYLARETEKKASFKAEFITACDDAIKLNPRLKFEVRAVRDEIVA